MSKVKISSKYQITIPKEYRGKLNPGQKLIVLQAGNWIKMLPIRDIRESRGFLKGIDSNINREP